MTTRADLTVRVTRTFTAAPERVFDAWLQPETIALWMFGHTGLKEEVVHLRTDPRVGGAFSFLVRRGDEEVDHVGHYLEIDRPRRLVFTWTVVPEPEEGSRVTIEIAPAAGGGCALTLTHEIPPAYAKWVKRTEEGWTRLLEALGRGVK
jgi:uncharacterized protein YndB with AHSA1/START domain